MAPRGRQPKKNRMGVGNTRMDAALDSMRQLGFVDKVVRETVDELLEVYDGTQGWPFIEEASYKLLIETILAKQQSPAAEETKEENPLQGHTRDEVIETSAAPTTGITEVGSSSLVAQDSSLQTNDGLDSASQTDDQDFASLGNETGVKEDLTVPDGRGGHKQEDIRVESRKNEPNPVANVTGSSSKSTLIEPFKIAFKKSLYRNRPHYGWSGRDDDKSKESEPKPVDNVIGSGSSAFGDNVKSTFVKPPMIESSKSPYGNHKPSYSADEMSKKYEPKPADNVTGSSRSSAFVNNVKSTFVKPPMIESSKSPYHNRKPSYGWSGSTDDKSKKSEPKPANNVTRSSSSTFVSNVESTFVRTPMIESSKSLQNVIESSKLLKNPHYCHRRPWYGWNDNDDEEVELTLLPIPPLPEHIEKLFGKSKGPRSSRQRRRTNRWDEKPEGM